VDDVHDVERIRAFNRRWTEVIGLLDAGLLGTPYSLPEARVIFELGRRDDDEPWEQIDLRRQLRMDPSYLTRIVARLQRTGLVTTHRSEVDRRHMRVALTPAGRTAFTDLDRRSAADELGIGPGDQIAVTPLDDQSGSTGIRVTLGPTR